MKTKARPRVLSFLLAFPVALLVGCGAGMTGVRVGRELMGHGRTAAIGERFKLEQEEEVSIKDTNLTIQLKSVRRTWYVDGKSETADADIIITLDGKEQRQWMDIGEKVTIGDYVVELRGADPFGKTSCEVVVAGR
jgi:hypothetical protein